MIVIEGIIGAGKTTLAKQIQERIPRSKLYEEPVGGNPYLAKFYQDPGRWALEMQYWLMAKRYQMHEEAIKEEWYSGITTIHDRSIYGDSVFASVLHQDGLIDDLGYHSYLQHRQCMEKSLLIPQQVIYLEVSVDVALSRIKGRGRDCENGITEEYLQKLSISYEKLIFDLGGVTSVEIIPWHDGMTADDIDLKGLIQYEN